MSRTSILGGEAGRRGFFGAGHSRARTVGLFIAAPVGMLISIIQPVPNFFIGLGLVGVVWIATATTHNGSLVTRGVTRFRIRDARKRGTDRFEPYSTAAWDETLEQAKKDPRAARLAAAGLRQMPDGADGMGWLEMRRSQPGIAWHAPVGEEQYLSVAYSVTGQIKGIESQASLESAAAAWGKFQASLGSTVSLARRVQTLTRVLPPDSARHEAWVKANFDPDAPIDLLRSYDQLLRQMQVGAMIQRHYVVVCWPLTPAFKVAAGRFGKGRDGWRALMTGEVSSIQRRLIAARMGTVQVLTARQTAAVIRHMQNPDVPIDQSADADPLNFGVPAPRVDRSAHVVESRDPVTGGDVVWWHRTARISGHHMSTGERTSLWTLPMLTGLARPIVRTLSLQRVIIPAGEAKRSARRDAVSDMSEQVAQSNARQLVDDDSKVRLSAAQRRVRDLRPGTGHHGVEWIGHLTISARSRDELAQAVRVVSEAADTGLGVTQLEWLDSYQPAASGTTWPIGRGLRPGGRTLSDKLADQLAGHGAKDAL